MTILQFGFYIIAQVILSGTTAFILALGFFHALDWWAGR